MRSLLTIILFFALTVASPVLAKPTAVDRLDLERYLGLWHEAARFPAFYQRGCTDATAVYDRAEKGGIAITNSCTRKGKRVSVTGNGKPNGVGKFKVSFFKFIPFRADYWVLWVEPNYKMAVIAVPDGKSAWILSRTPKPSQTQLKKALGVLKDNGYDPAKLIWNPGVTPPS
ncbi:MAG: lipocalin family protein [Pseudomonadota bacterium]